MLSYKLAALLLTLLSYLTVPAPPTMPALRPYDLPAPVVIDDRVWVILYPVRLPRPLMALTVCQTRTILVKRQACSEWVDTILHESFHAFTRCYRESEGHFTVHDWIYIFADAGSEMVKMNPEALRCPSH